MGTAALSIERRCFRAVSSGNGDGIVAKLPAKVKRCGSVQYWAFGVERWAFPLYLEVNVDPTLVDPIPCGSFASR